MGRSQETFNKKEREKKKLKKKQDKQDKKEERKASAAKSQNFEEMLAYVDENGNISSTPPDPKKKKEIKQEDIQIAIDKHENVDPSEDVREGTVIFFNESKGFGFIKDSQTQESIFVHIQGLIDPIQAKDKVSFQITTTPKGYSAVDVRAIH